MFNGSLSGSTISNRSKNIVSCNRKISSPSVLSYDTKTSKVSEKDNPEIFTLRISIMHFYPNLTFKDIGKFLGRNLNKIRVMLVKTSIKSQAILRTRTLSAVNDERRQVLPSKVILDRTIDRFEVFRNHVECNYKQIIAGYLFGSSFQVVYLERSVDCYDYFLDEVTSASQIKKDVYALYSALLSACQSGVGHRILMENRDKQRCHSFMGSVGTNV
jgi:hypothetical protein